MKPKQLRAVALRYEALAPSAKLIAKGDGEVARAIIEKAREHGVFVHESEELMRLLIQVELEATVPEEVCIIVSELLGWLESSEVNS
ncbi:EscU/YscU/HrcU family type III secretion system export apparatus switch protein [Pseudidiomarina insulisalsae]|uniref:Flagellar biosynthetic protein FlhB n=1 Tax=Pseudidiomarina insulisalsae TaxID=575789 RepID=A0A432YDJ5_9GAMM|nr:EscU/YscU/HrcU family type III secretion system export apparatus switch protein [Pseudidiomarina insulisalsae]RUO59065.1 flagellar biosynthesis protein [Pseudidiomarina insulisalsae]